MRGSSVFVVSVGLSIGLSVGMSACSKDGKDGGDKAPPAPGSAAKAGSGSSVAIPHKPRIPQVTPPVPVEQPPSDATKTPSGLVYKILTANPSGVQPGRNDAVLINYTGWKQATGETFFSNKGRGQPFKLNLVQSAPGFVESLQLMHKGETAMLWMPPEIGYRTPPPKPEPLVYQVELVDVIAAPPVPDDVAKPPANATSLPSGTKRVVVKPGTGKDKPRQFDTVTFQYTVWDASGKMLDTSTTRDRATSAPPYKESPALFEILTAMTVGERDRIWVDAARTAGDGRGVPGAKGVVCYEVELQSITKAAHDAPPPPPDVAKPPADAKKSPKGVFYRVLKAGGGKDARHPAETDTVKVHYTGWHTDGQMFDSSVLRGDKATFNLKSVVAGWTDGIPQMTVGDTFRFWIPEELAYKGQPGKPKGMLVFDVELFEIVAPTSH